MCDVAFCMSQVKVVTNHAVVCSYDDTCGVSRIDVKGAAIIGIRKIDNKGAVTDG